MGREHHRLARLTPARRPEPSWRAVAVGTIRLRLRRRSLIAIQMTGGPVSRGRALSWGLGIVWLVVAVASVISLRGPGPVVTGAHRAATSLAAAQVQASAWITTQVSADATVACDPVMCSALRASGLPGARLLVLKPAAAGPLDAEVVVATPAVRSLLGTRLGADAPLVIAGFGSGAGPIDIRLVAAHGAAAFETALKGDGRARIAAGGQLLGNGRISVSAAARAALATGRVDPRLLVTLAALLAQQPVRIVAFGDLPPGASPAVPFRSADISTARTSASRGDGLAAMVAFLHAQLPPYVPARVRIIRGTGGQSVLDIEFGAPSPLGLLSSP